MKIIITGGHHNSALVVAQALQARGNLIYWLGHKYTIVGDNKVSAEYLEVTKAGISFYPIVAGKLQLKQNFILHLARIPYGFIQNLYKLMQIKPDVIYSSGGYIALPTCIVAKLLNIPVFTHEQAIVTGLANRIIARFATRIYTAFPSKYPYPPAKTRYTGLPIRPELLNHEKSYFSNKRRTVYITGGKQGSHLINEVVFTALAKLLSKYNIVHQCGSNSIFADYEKALAIQKQLGSLAKYYFPCEYFTVEQIGSVYYNADLVVGRSGAHTVYELLYLSKPCIAIPIPWTHGDEQNKNAQLLVDYGIGKVLSETELTKDTLLATIDDMVANLSTYKRNAVFEPIDNTVEIIVDDMYTTIAKTALKH